MYSIRKASSLSCAFLAISDTVAISLGEDRSISFLLANLKSPCTTAITSSASERFLDTGNSSSKGKSLERCSLIEESSDFLLETSVEVTFFRVSLTSIFCKLLGTVYGLASSSPSASSVLVVTALVFPPVYSGVQVSSHEYGLLISKSGMLSFNSLAFKYLSY